MLWRRLWVPGCPRDPSPAELLLQTGPGREREQTQRGECRASERRPPFGLTRLHRGDQRGVTAAPVLGVRWAGQRLSLGVVSSPNDDW